MADPTCIVCNVAIPAKDPSKPGSQAWYCGSRCRRKGWQDKHPKPSPVPTTPRTGRPYVRKPQVFRAGICVECGEGYIFHASSHAPLNLYCSRSCSRRTAKRVRRAREHEASGSFTWDGFTKLALALGNVCSYCGDGGPLEPDHVVPLKRGGHNGLTNILPACKSCNGRKSDMTLREWDRRLQAAGHPPVNLARFKHLTAHVWFDTHAA